MSSVDNKQCINLEKRKYLWEGFIEVMELELAPVEQNNFILFLLILFCPDLKTSERS